MIEGENESNIEYKENDIVWVKVKGYPWWPSIIKHISFRNIQSYEHNIKEKIYNIELIGEKINTKVSKDKIESFKKNYEQHINTKNMSLLKSIEIANKIYDKKNNSKIVYLKENAQDKNNRKEKDLTNVNNQNASSKKFLELNEGKNICEKDNDKNMKYLKKKRINEKVILDDDNITDNNDDNRSNITHQNKEDIKIIPTQKNNIKINININVTTNNQNTVNINSFHPSDVLSQKNKQNNNIISNPNFNPINISNLSSNEKNIFINNINDNNNINVNNYYMSNQQELTNRNQFSDYDFRKKSGGDINEYYNEIRKRKQQIRDQYKQIEQENFLNAQRKKQEKEMEKEREREIMYRNEYRQPPEELDNMIMRENKLKQKNLVDQINFNREINNINENLLKNEKQKKIEEFKKSLDEQVNQKKKMQEIKELMDNKGQKQDIYDINQQFIEDVKNIQNKYEVKPDMIMMNNIISNNNKMNSFE